MERETIMIKELEYTKSVGHNSIAQYMLTDAQPASSLQPITSFPVVYVVTVLPYGMGYPFGHLGSPVLAVSPHSLL